MADDRDDDAMAKAAGAMCGLIDAVDALDTPATISARARFHRAQAEADRLGREAYDHRQRFGKLSKKKQRELDAARDEYRAAKQALEDAEMLARFERTS